MSRKLAEPTAMAGSPELPPERHRHLWTMGESQVSVSRDEGGTEKQLNVLMYFGDRTKGIPEITEGLSSRKDVPQVKAGRGRAGDELQAARAAFGEEWHKVGGRAALCRQHCAGSGRWEAPLCVPTAWLCG